MMWSVVLAVTLSVVLMEVMPSSQQPVSDDDDTAVRLLGGEVYIPPRPKPPHQRDVSDGSNRGLSLSLSLSLSVSHDAIRMLAGVTPIDLQIEEKVKSETGRDSGIMAEALAGNRKRQGDLRIHAGHQKETAAEFVTGHRNLEANLKRFNPGEEERCEYGELETANHERRDLRQVMTSKHLQRRRANFDFDGETIKELRTTTRRNGIKREGNRVLKLESRRMMKKKKRKRKGKDARKREIRTT
ncbi:hypothetical protein J6590_101802 [Homalodisca vitripennis]|nr:hypothetical protein J6590_101802 [Homalodisca vitripennis]